MNDLQRFLRDLVRSTGVPQNELARRAGMTEKHISWMMTGHSRGSLSAWQALIDAAGVDLPSPSATDLYPGPFHDPREI